MRAFKALIASLVLLNPLVIMADEAEEAPASESNFSEALENAVQERPRLYRGPFRSEYFEAMHHRPFGMYRGYWPYRHGTYPAYIVPGRNSIWFAAGSGGYLGTGFTTSQYFPEQGITLALSASWEKGEHYWFNDLDYEAFTLSPRLQWTNGNSSLWLGLDYTDVQYQGQAKRPRLRVATPYASEALSESTHEPWQISDETLEEFSVGVRQRIGDFMDIGVSYREGKSRF